MSLRGKLRQSLLAQLVYRDFKSRYSGTVFGVLWAVIQPLAMISVLYAVFNYGLKVGTAADPLFVPWLFVGMVCWNFFSDALGSMTGSFHEYAFLVKKVQFPLHVIPAVKLMTAGLMHLLFLVIVALILVSYGLTPSLYWVQVPLMTFVLGAGVFGLGLITSSLNVFVKDVSQLVGVILQFAFWGTPVVWSASRVPEHYRWLLKLNPMYGMLSGYRAALVESRWFVIEDGLWSLSLVGIAAIFLIFGFYTHGRLKRHFADVL